MPDAYAYQNQQLGLLRQSELSDLRRRVAELEEENAELHRLLEEAAVPIIDQYRAAVAQIVVERRALKWNPQATDALDRILAVLVDYDDRA